MQLLVSATNSQRFVQRQPDTRSDLPPERLLWGIDAIYIVIRAYVAMKDTQKRVRFTELWGHTSSDS